MKADTLTYEGAAAMSETPETLLASNRALYGPLKVTSEKEVRSGSGQPDYPSGLIVGPGDETDRFTYWPLRVARGGEVLAPGEATDPVQFIDVRDLAEWTIRMAEQGVPEPITEPAEEEVYDRRNAGGHQAGDESDAQFTGSKRNSWRRKKSGPGAPCRCGSPRRARWRVLPDQHSEGAWQGTDLRSFSDTTQATLDWIRQQPSERRANLKAE